MDEQAQPPETSKETPRLQNGGKRPWLRRGNPGNKGGGRTPDEFRRKMAELASRDDVLDYLSQCLEGKYGARAAVAAHKHVSERGYGREVQPISVTELPAIVVRREG